MATIIERDIHHSHGESGDSSMSVMIVAIVALALIAGFALFFFRLFPFNTVTPAENTGGTINIDAELPATAPGTTAQ